MTVNLTPSRVNFYTYVTPFSLGYNIKKVRLIQKSASGVLSTLAEVTPSLGATSVVLEYPGQCRPRPLVRRAYSQRSGAAPSRDHQGHRQLTLR